MARLYNYIIETETGKTDYTKLPSASTLHKFLLEPCTLPCHAYLNRTCIILDFASCHVYVMVVYYVVCSFPVLLLLVSSGNIAFVRIRSTTSVCLLHGLVLLPCGISVAGADDTSAGGATQLKWELDEDLVRCLCLFRLISSGAQLGRPGI
ncbi:hypothetical protein VPH35_021357 [Triticum aestivum]